MSYLRIIELADRPSQRDGEWYALDGRPGSVRLDRGDGALAPHADGGGDVITTWTGVRIYRGGTVRKGSIVYMLKYPVPLDYLYEFDAWFQYEHMPMLLEEPSWYGCEFFRALGASSYPFAALQYVEPQALKSDARNRSVDTPWWHRLCKHEWFDKQFTRTIMRPL